MKIKILIAYHKKSKLFKDDILTPIHVGRAVANKNGPDYQWLLDNMIGDDTGDNISHKNPYYNELTALYWAWKNYDKLGNPDYIGLMHYRRHFIFNPNDKSIVKPIATLKDDYLDLIQYSKEHLESLLSKYDFIYYQGRVKSVYSQYNDHHRIEDLDLAIKLLKRHSPSYALTAKKYIKKSYGCFGNMFILPKKDFFRYCEYIFPILEDFEKCVDLTNRRLFISERLTGIFIDKLSKKYKKPLPLSSTFVCEKLVCHLALNYNPKETYQTSVLINSVLTSNKYPDIEIHWHLINSHPNVDKTCFDVFKGPSCVFDWIDVEPGKYSDEFLPAYLGEILPPSIGKVLFLDNKTVVFGSLDVILEACNTFEFMAVHSEAPTSNIYCLNTKLLRLNNVSEKLKDYKKDLVSFFKEYFPHETKEMAYWVVLNISKEHDGEGLYLRKTRSLEETEHWVYDRCMLHYETGLEPWLNFKCAYCIYWWEKAQSTQIENQKLTLDVPLVVNNFANMNIDFLRNYEKIEDQNIKIDHFRKKIPVRAIRKLFSYAKRAVKKILKRGERK